MFLINISISSAIRELNVNWYIDVGVPFNVIWTTALLFCFIFILFFSFFCIAFSLAHYLWDLILSFFTVIEIVIGVNAIAATVTGNSVAAITTNHRSNSSSQADMNGNWIYNVCTCRQQCKTIIIRIWKAKEKTGKPIAPRCLCVPHILLFDENSCVELNILKWYNI